MPEIITRAEARARGLRYYYTGKPCPRGHVCERLTSNWCCRACSKPHNAAFRERHPERQSVHSKRYRERHPEMANANSKRWRQRNPEKVYEHVKRWRARYPEKHVAQAKRYAARHPEKTREQSRKYAARHPSRCRDAGCRSERVRREMIRLLEEMGFFLPTDTRRERLLMLSELRRMGVIKKEDWIDV